MRLAVPFAAILVLTLGLTGEAVPAAEPAGYDRLYLLAGDYPLGEGTSRFDYLSLDPDTNRLFIAKMGSGKLLAFDLASMKLIAELDGYPRTTGNRVIPGRHKIYVSVPNAGLAATVSIVLGLAGLSTGSGGLAVVDTKTLTETARLPGGVFPDGIAFDPKHNRIFVSDEFGQAVLVVDADKDQLIARIEAGGETGNVQFDPKTGRIYAPNQSGNEYLAIDPAAATVAARHPLPGCDHPHGLAVAPEGGIGYIACDGNNRLLTVELASGAVLSSAAVCADPDVLGIDAGAKRLYVAGETGILSTFDLTDPVAPKPLGDVFAGPDAHSFAIDPDTHRLYFPFVGENGTSVLRVLMPKP